MERNVVVPIGAVSTPMKIITTSHQTVSRNYVYFLKHVPHSLLTDAQESLSYINETSNLSVNTDAAR